MAPARDWWNGFQRDYRDQGVEFSEGPIRDGAVVPGELFDSAGDNLLQNALRKRKMDEAVRVRVSFRCDEVVALVVEDDGEPVPPEVLGGLLKGPVPSSSGFGIGLFQTARLAESAGYTLALDSNVSGAVRFAMSGTTVASASNPA